MATALPPGNSPKYVVLLGDVGTGKSTIVEKLTGESGRSSKATHSATATAESFMVPDKSLIICDTPGANATANTFTQNIWIAQAMNFMAVSKILVTVKADTRIDNVVRDVDEYANRFLNMDEDLLGVIVTHMDQVTWDEKTCIDDLKNHLGIDDVVFTRLHDPDIFLQKKILGICKKTHNLTVDDENFLKLFKVSDKKRSIVRSTKKEVEEFKTLYREFYEERQKFNTPKDMTDLIFEFQAWMGEWITSAQTRVAELNGFTFDGIKAANEAGHIAFMTNEMTKILKELRIEALAYQTGHGVNELRRCPFCKLVWAKFEGCDWETTCGERPIKPEVRDANFCVLGIFTFSWDGRKLEITRSGERQVEGANSPKGMTNMTAAQMFDELYIENAEERGDLSIGCGREITWTQMPIVEVPPEFSEAQPVSVDDVTLLP